MKNVSEEISVSTDKKLINDLLNQLDASMLNIFMIALVGPRSEEDIKLIQQCIYAVMLMIHIRQSKTELDKKGSNN